MRALLLIVLLVISPTSIPVIHSLDYTLSFDGTSAMSYLTGQCDFGTRPPGSENLSQCRNYIVETIDDFGWNVELQNFTYRSTACANIIARGGPPENVSLLFGAHYDTRPKADYDPDPSKRDDNILGANDGASGTAVLMELARILPEDIRDKIELVFFDAEDSGGVNGWDWIVGSNYYVDQLDAERRANITAMILVDIVGDTNLRLPRELNSNRALQDTVWSIAANLGYSDIFLNVNGHYITDDHIPFRNAGIPALDIIHYPFPSYWHTTGDTPDKCSASSLEVVGQVLEYFIMNSTGWSGGFPTEDTLLQQLGLIVTAGFVIAGVVIILYRRR